MRECCGTVILNGSLICSLQLRRLRVARAGGQMTLDHLHAELGNLRQALAWASAVPVDGKRVTLGLQLCISCRDYWRLRHDPREGAGALDQLLELVDPLVAGGRGTSATKEMVPPAVLAFARTELMRVRASGVPGAPSPWIRMTLDEAITYFRSVGDRHGEGRALHALSDFVAWTDGDGAESRALALHAAEVAEVSRDGLTGPLAHGRVAIAELFAGRDDEAGDRFLPALRLAKSSGNTHAITNSHWLLGHFQFNKRQWEEADIHLSEAEAQGGVVAFTCLLRSEIDVHAGNFPRAREHLNRLADRIATGHIPEMYLPLVQIGRGSVARLEGSIT